MFSANHSGRERVSFTFVFKVFVRHMFVVYSVECVIFRAGFTVLLEKKSCLTVAYDCMILNFYLI
jgi:hypothetical protein